MPDDSGAIARQRVVVAWLLDQRIGLARIGHEQLAHGLRRHAHLIQVHALSAGIGAHGKNVALVGCDQRHLVLLEKPRQRIELLAALLADLYGEDEMPAIGKAKGNQRMRDGGPHPV